MGVYMGVVRDGFNFSQERKVVKVILFRASDRIKGLRVRKSLAFLEIESGVVR